VKAIITLPPHFTSEIPSGFYWEGEEGSEDHSHAVEFYTRQMRLHGGGMEKVTTKENEAIQRLDQVFDKAFDANHPAMLDYITLKFMLQRLEKELKLRVDSAKELRDHLRDCNMMDFLHKKELAHYKTTAEREAFLHDLDHKLADQWQTRVVAADELHLADETTINQTTRQLDRAYDVIWKHVTNSSMCFVCGRERDDKSPGNEIPHPDNCLYLVADAWRKVKHEQTHT
jgi:hypothetical protein